MDNPTPTPVITPLIALFHSRRFIVALCTLIVGAVCIAVPDLQPIRSELLILLVTLALAVIGGYSISDASANGRVVAQEPPKDPAQTLKEIIEQLIDAGLGVPQSSLAQLQALPGTEIRLDHYIAPDGSIVSLPAGSKLTAIIKSPGGFHSLADVDYLKTAAKESN